MKDIGNCDQFYVMYKLLQSALYLLHAVRNLKCPLLKELSGRFFKSNGTLSFKKNNVPVMMFTFKLF